MSEPAGPKRTDSPGFTVKISDEVHRGVYANRVISAHSGEEFVLDFVADLPPGPAIVARVITAPAHAAALLEALDENIRRYQQQHGPIRRPGPSPAANA